ncbi:MAG: TonB-dependent receptor [Chloroherpetonaceae bacterium]|nr:TonB-dependent receptor [Chloroherpetonaceae bacterium]
MMHCRLCTYFVSLAFFATELWAQESATVFGTVRDRETGEAIAGAAVYLKAQGVGTVTDAKGEFRFAAPPFERDSLKVSAGGYEPFAQALDRFQLSQPIEIRLVPLSFQASDIFVRDQKVNAFGISKLASVEGVAIYEAKKTERIVLADLTGNFAANNARQTFAKVSGLNIWESDGAGLQLGIGGRGLSPNRTSNFNVRQNGYDISADPLGYPESYYTPPFEALDRIEIVRGAASLQYGTQFGGMLNFVFKEGPAGKPFEFLTRQTLGSFGLFNSFNSIGGTLDRLNYYGFYQFKRGDGWRPNSEFYQHTAYLSTRYALSEKLSLTLNYTFMHYLARQPGGLTDNQFATDPRQSLRPRNWFRIDWQVAALTADYHFSELTRLNSRFYGLLSSRQSVGNLDVIFKNDDVPRLDGTRNRTLIHADFRNLANETRFIHRYNFFGNLSSFLAGFRIFHGRTTQKQGDADASANPTFEFLNPNEPENSSYLFPNTNFSVFAENIFVLTPQLSITPGVRYENIQTFAEGYFKQYVYDGAGNTVAVQRTDEFLERRRAFVFFGVGLSYTPSSSVEVYANFSQNYRSITFSDLRIVNPNFAVDPHIQDERGFNADFGVRGNWEGLVYYDLTLFMLGYNNQIGLLLKNDQPPLFLPYRLRTNIADSRTIGIETFIEADVARLFNRYATFSLSLFSNFALLDARYINTDEPSIRQKRVELVPPITFRSGLTFRQEKFQATVQFSYTGEHFTDATNAVRTATAVNGIIPAYWVADASLRYQIGLLSIEAGVTNLTNNFYFTRRADSYPGPGIIPAEIRNFYLTLGAAL